MKKVLTIRSLLINSFLVIIFAACGANAHKNAEICSGIDSQMYLPKDSSAKPLNEDSSHPMVLPKSPDFEKNSHPMIVSPCSKSEN